MMSTTTSLVEAITRVLADAEVCKAKGRRMRSYLEVVKPHIEQLERTGQNTIRIEGVLQEVLRLVQATQRRGASPLARIMSWACTYGARASLEAAEQHLQTELAVFNLTGVDAEQLHVQHVCEDAEDDPEDARQVRADVTASQLDADVKAQFDAVLDAEELDRRLANCMNAIATALDAETANIAPDMLVVQEEELLGHGRFGDVLAGVYENSDQVAVKRAPDPVLQLHEQQALRREMQQWRRMRYAYIVELHGTCVQRDNLLLVLERCMLSLEALLYDRTDVTLLSVGLQASILEGVACGMAYLHEQHIIHGAIRPVNVLLTWDSVKLKLAGFELARAELADLTPAARAYMAPEVLLPPALWTEKADVYAFGMLGLAVVHRQQPHGQPEFSPTETNYCPWLVELVSGCCTADAKTRPRAQEVPRRMRTSAFKPESYHHFVEHLFSVLRRLNSGQGAGAPHISYGFGVAAAYAGFPSLMCADAATYSSQLPEFLSRPLHPDAGVVQFHIKRSYDYNKYVLVAEETDEPVMTATRHKHQGYELQVNGAESGQAIAHLDMNFGGTVFLLHDAAQDLACVTYAVNRVLNEGPRKMMVGVPAVRKESGDLAAWDHTSLKASALVRALKSNATHNLLSLVNKPPQWDTSREAHALNFGGRVTRASVKNFQLVDELRDPGHERIIMQHGRDHAHGFIMDVQHPLSVLQAFGVALSSLHFKYFVK